MAVLSSKARDHLRKSTFGLPNERKYPMPDHRHAALAKARALQEYRKGNITKAQYDEIIAKANKVLAS